MSLADGVMEALLIRWGWTCLAGWSWHRVLRHLVLGVNSKKMVTFEPCDGLDPEMLLRAPLGAHSITHEGVFRFHIGATAP